jgi:hypothetical protein
VVISHKKNEDRVYITFGNAGGLTPKHFSLSAATSLPET